MGERLERVKHSVQNVLAHRKEVKRLSLKLIYDMRKVLSTAEKTIVDTDRSLDQLARESMEVKQDIQDLMHPENAYVLVSEVEET